MVSLRLQLKIGDGSRLGQGKVRLLEEIERTGSISAAARALGMNYRRGWELVDQMARAFGRPVVLGTTGGLGGAELTPLGRDIVARFRTLEQEVSQIATQHLRAFDEMVAQPSEEPSAAAPARPAATKSH